MEVVEQQDDGRARRHAFEERVNGFEQPVALGFRVGAQRLRETIHLCPELRNEPGHVTTE